MAFFDKVYPFTTESISGYIEYMDVKDKSVLTVGSSLDQVLNACLYGSKDITLIDISKNSEDYMKYKLYHLYNSSTREELYKTICETEGFRLAKHELFSLEALQKMCPYLRDEESFNLLKDNIKDTKLNYVHGDIYKMDEALDNKTYDRMILSNVLQYVDSYRGDVPFDKFIKDNFEVFIRHLNNEGILELLYIYGYCSNNQFVGFRTSDLLNALSDYLLEVWIFKTGALEDATLVYTKK